MREQERGGRREGGREGGREGEREGGREKSGQHSEYSMMGGGGVNMLP